MSKSTWIRPDRGIEALENHLVGKEPQPMWDSTERPPDPMAYRIRTLMHRYLSPNHAEVLEQKYFLMYPTAEIARRRGVTERAVRGMIDRAKNNLLKVIAKHGDEVREVPEDEL